ncbi:MAG: DUF4260 domain-containing protein [Flavobacteriales bacterium]
MKNLLKLEEAAQFAFCLVMLALIHVQWWVYPLLLLGPDIGMVGYLVSPRIGAFTYNVLHHKGIAFACILFGQLASFSLAMDGLFGDGDEYMMLVGIILFGHASMDRIFGYGLKYSDAFKHTHLGWIGKKDSEQLSS